MSRFKTRDRFAACNGTAPIEVASGTMPSAQHPRPGAREGSRQVAVRLVGAAGRAARGEGDADDDQGDAG